MFRQETKTITQGKQTFAVSVPVIGDLTVEPEETFFVNVTNVVGAVLGDGQGQGTIQNDDVTTVSCTRTHFISQVQGSGNTSPLNGQAVTVEAIVTANKFNGFLVQERDTNADGNPLRSEGSVVVANNANGPAVGWKGLGGRAAIGADHLQQLPLTGLELCWRIRLEQAFGERQAKGGGHRHAEPLAQ